MPVLFNEVIDSLNIKANGTYMDGTVGGAGHSSGICKRLSDDGHLVAVDRDSVALETAMERLSKFSCKKTFIHANYSDVDKIRTEIGKVDGILLDLGVFLLSTGYSRARVFVHARRPYGYAYE